MEYKIKMLDGERFFGGSTEKGTANPFDKNSEAAYDFCRSCPNQTMPLFLSTKGRYIYSDNPFAITFSHGEITVEGEDVLLVTAGTTLREAYLAAMREHFPFDGRRLPERFFTTAQYNTWMEFTYFPTQEGVLKYARGIVDNGFTPGILIIDEGWHGRYGEWEFDFARFPTPRAMVDELHELGFTVMLWVTPLVCADGHDFICSIIKALGGGEDYDKVYIRNKEGRPGLFFWWNGYSAMLDFRKECDTRFLASRLDRLMAEYGVDGFKFDGGSVAMYHPENMVNGTPRDDHDPHAMNAAWNEFGLRYEYHEFKDSYRRGGKNTIQRLSDRNHSWEGAGINTLLPCSLLQGLMGHPFLCPDMIGGGQWTCAKDPDFLVDEELFVRMAQASALMPMMQFSWAPWRALSPESLALVKAAADLHRRLSPEILALVRRAETEGEPIMRSLEYCDPGHGYEYIADEFMLGDDILVAPIVTKGTFRKEIVFPSGTWRDEDGNLYEGGKTHTVDTPIEKLPWFRRVKG